MSKKRIISLFLVLVISLPILLLPVQVDARGKKDTNRGKINVEEKKEKEELERKERREKLDKRKKEKKDKKILINEKKKERKKTRMKKEKRYMLSGRRL